MKTEKCKYCGQLPKFSTVAQPDYVYGGITMKLICNGIEKETKYSNGWLDSYGKQWIYEDMETNHLMNVYKHIENNFKHYVGINIGKYPTSVTTGYLDEAIAFTKAVRAEIKSELLSRGLTDSEIENHIEETWKMGSNPYKVEV